MRRMLTTYPRGRVAEGRHAIATDARIGAIAPSSRRNLGGACEASPPIAQRAPKAQRENTAWRSKIRSIEGGLRIRTLLLALAFSMFASLASAQFTGAGGFAPLTFNAPAAAASAGSRRTDAWSSDAPAANCRTEIRGRSGPVSQCDPPPPAKAN
jgi:hypothetical protein